MNDNSLNIKERALLFAKKKGVSNKMFYLSIRVNPGYFMGESKGILPSPEILQRIRLRYSTLNFKWLLTGEGKMLSNQKMESCVSCKEKDQEIHDLLILNVHLKNKIASMKKRRKKAKKKSDMKN
jgi:hypothetical protein